MAEHHDASRHQTPPQHNPLHPPQPKPQASTPSSAAGASGPGGTPSGPALNPRSCVTCRRRKVRCDKRYPCSNCQKAHIDCVFPAPGRAPRKPRKPPDTELLARLRRLEGVVQSLGVQVDDEPPPADKGAQGSNGTAQVKLESGTDTGIIGDVRTENALNESFGRLVIDDKGRSRYVNNRFWAALSNEVEDLKQILDEESEEELESPSPMTDVMSSPGTHGYLLSSNTNQVDLHAQHPPPKLAKEYWQAYLEYYDPLMRMLHIPTTQKLLYELIDNHGKASRAEETLLFAIYYSAVSALPAEELLQKTGETQDVLQKRYRQATEQALTRSHLLFTEEILLLQAFIIYLFTIRRFEDSRVIWSLCGLACRIAITMGLHRDGSNFAISPLDVEIRRRTWWQILVLDIRASEYHGWDPVIVQHAFDTKFPLNVEDEDLTSATTKTPTERQGITSISFCLTRFETAMLYAKLHTRPSTAFDVVVNSMRQRPGERRTGISLQEKEKWIQDTQKHLEDKFFRYCNVQDPNHWLAATLTRMIFSKQWLSLLHPYLRLDQGASLSKATKERIFTISLESIEYALLIHEQCKKVKWGWLFQNWSQFHALASILSELRVATEGPLVDRAWQAVDATVELFGQKQGDGKNGHNLWRPIRKLYDTAKADRERALSSMDAESEEDDSDVEYEQSDYSQMKSEYAEPSRAATFSTVGSSNAFSRTNSLLVEQNLPAVPHVRNNEYYVPNNHPQQHQQPQQRSYNPTIQSQVHQQWPNVSNTNQQPPNNWYYDSNAAIPSTQTNNPWGPMSINGSVMPNVSPASQNMNSAQQGYPTGLDSIFSGYAGMEDFGMQWNEWDDMMREFETQGPGVGNAGAPGASSGGVPGGSQRHPLGETWL